MYVSMHPRAIGLVKRNRLCTSLLAKSIDRTDLQLYIISKKFYFQLFAMNTKYLNTMLQRFLQECSKMHMCRQTLVNSMPIYYKSLHYAMFPCAWLLTEDPQHVIL